MVAKLDKIKKVNNMDKAECCPKLDPKPCDGRILEWTNKKFIKDKIFTIFYISINFGSVMGRLDEKVRRKQARQYRTDLAFLITPQNGIWIFILQLAKKFQMQKT